MIVAQIIFWSFIFLLAYTYVIYPAFLLIVGKFFKDNKDTYILETDLPKISILMSVYNEEKIIQEKIESVFTTNYPLSKIELIIGSDKSTDQTHSIINDLKNTFPEILWINEHELTFQPFIWEFMALFLDAIHAPERKVKK